MCEVNFGGPQGFRIHLPPKGLHGLRSLRHLLTGVDVEESEKTLTVSVPLPGLSRDDFELNVGPDAIVITFKEKEVREENQEENDFKTPWPLCGPSCSGTRRFPLPTEVDPETAKAKLENGMLKVTVERKNPGKRISVD